MMPNMHSLGALKGEFMEWPAYCQNCRNQQKDKDKFTGVEYVVGSSGEQEGFELALNEKCKMCGKEIKATMIIVKRKKVNIQGLHTWSVLIDVVMK
jgi:hypothetical protein